MNRGSCRVIGGKWRGRKITFDDADGLRPTTDRIRETVFNWLQPYIYQGFCLDCFAGSGVLGLEALSRGAEKVVFIESNKNTVKNLKQNCKRLDAEAAIILHQDALSWLQAVRHDQRPEQPFDLVFLDPPFHSNLLEKSCELLNCSGVLAEDAIIYVEHAVATDITLPENWSCLKQKTAGQVAYKLFEHHVV